MEGTLPPSLRLGQGSQPSRVPTFPAAAVRDKLVCSDRPDRGGASCEDFPLLPRSRAFERLRRRAPAAQRAQGEKGKNRDERKFRRAPRCGVNAADRSPSAGSEGAAVEVLDRNGVEVDAFEAPDVDGSHVIAFRVHALGVRMNPAGRAGPMLDDVLVERIRRRAAFRCQETKLAPRHEPQPRTLARAYRAVAGERAAQLTFNLDRGLPRSGSFLCISLALLLPITIASADT